MKNTSIGTSTSSNDSFAAPGKSLLLYTAVFGICFLHGSLSARADPEKSGSSDFGEARYAVRLVGENILKKLSSRILGAVRNPHVAVSGSVKGDTVRVEVNASGSKSDRKRETAQEVITLERRGGILTLDQIERNTSHGTETINVEANSDIGFGRTVVLKRGKEELSGQIDPATPIVPFQALAIWLATEDGKKLSSEKNRAIYVVLDTEVTRYGIHRGEGKGHEQTWQLLETEHPQDGISITLEYRGGDSPADKIWPAVITLDHHGEGARFEKEP